MINPHYRDLQKMHVPATYLLKSLLGLQIQDNPIHTFSPLFFQQKESFIPNSPIAGNRVSLFYLTYLPRQENLGTVPLRHYISASHCLCSPSHFGKYLTKLIMYIN